MTTPSDKQHLKYLQQTIELARQSTPLPTNFRVGCIIISSVNRSSPHILSTGYTLELPGNTHAEQCALSKLASNNNVSEDNLSTVLTAEVNATLYTSLEPCGKRLSGNLPCVQRIIATRGKDPNGGIRKVIFGAKEPGTFVADSQSCETLTAAGVEWEYVPVLEEEILKVAMEGHSKQPVSNETPKESHSQGVSSQEQPRGPASTDEDTASEELPQRDSTQPRNPKKRMMEVPLQDS